MEDIPLHEQIADYRMNCEITREMQQAVNEERKARDERAAKLVEAERKRLLAIYGGAEQNMPYEVEETFTRLAEQIRSGND